MQERIRELIDLLSNPEPAIRFNAAEELKRFGPDAEAAVFALVQRIDDPVPTVQIEVIEALGAVGPAAERAIRPLIALAETTGAALRSAILKSLKQISGMELDQTDDALTSRHTRAVSLTPQMTEQIRKMLNKDRKEN